MSEEITKDLTVPKRRAPMQRNQIIAIWFTASPVVMGFAAMWAGKLTGIEWYDKTTLFVMGALAVVLGAAAAIKRAEAKAEGEAAKNDPC